MTTTNEEYLNTFESRLTNELLRLCTSYNMLDNTLLATEDIDDEWKGWHRNISQMP
jgi:hypothetical protein